MNLEIKHFPLSYRDLKVFDKNNNVLFEIKSLDSLEDKTIINQYMDSLVRCANYGKRALLKKKMQTYPDMSMEEAEALVLLDMNNKGYCQCKVEEVEFQYTIKIIKSDNILFKPISKVLNFKSKS